VLYSTRLANELNDANDLNVLNGKEKSERIQLRPRESCTERRKVKEANNLPIPLLITQINHVAEAVRKVLFKECKNVIL
jgi:hypothetical protein